MRSHAIGEVAVHTNAVLEWGSLAALLDESLLIRRVSELRQALASGAYSDRPSDASGLALAVRYAAGWRPRDSFGELIGLDRVATGPADDEAVDSAPEDSSEADD